MTEREALKLALEALELGDDASLAERDRAITAIKEVSAQPEQEPVAWLHTKIEGIAVPHRPADLDKHPDRWTALYPESKPCPTCEALARTVMMDQTAHDAQRRPLPPQSPCEMTQAEGKMFKLGWLECEAAHGIKE